MLPHADSRSPLLQTAASISSLLTQLNRRTVPAAHLLQGARQELELPQNGSLEFRRRLSFELQLSASQIPAAGRELLLSMALASQLQLFVLAEARSGRDALAAFAFSVSTAYRCLTGWERRLRAEFTKRSGDGEGRERGATGEVEKVVRVGQEGKPWVRGVAGGPREVQGTHPAPGISMEHEERTADPASAGAAESAAAPTAHLEGIAPLQIAAVAASSGPLLPDRAGAETLSRLASDKVFSEPDTLLDLVEHLLFRVVPAVVSQECFRELRGTPAVADVEFVFGVCDVQYRLICREEESRIARAVESLFAAAVTKTRQLFLLDYVFERFRSNSLGSVEAELFLSQCKIFLDSKLLEPEHLAAIYRLLAFYLLQGEGGPAGGAAGRFGDSTFAPDPTDAPLGSSLASSMAATGSRAGHPAQLGVRATFGLSPDACTRRAEALSPFAAATALLDFLRDIRRFNLFGSRSSATGPAGILDTYLTALVSELSTVDRAYSEIALVYLTELSVQYDLAEEMISLFARHVPSGLISPQLFCRAYDVLARCLSAPEDLLLLAKLCAAVSPAFLRQKAYFPMHMLLSQVLASPFLASASGDIVFPAVSVVLQVCDALIEDARKNPGVDGHFERAGRDLDSDVPALAAAAEAAAKVDAWRVGRKERPLPALVRLKIEAIRFFAKYCLYRVLDSLCGVEGASGVSAVSGARPPGDRGERRSQEPRGVIQRLMPQALGPAQARVHSELLDRLAAQYAVYCSLSSELSLSPKRRLLDLFLFLELFVYRYVIGAAFPGFSTSADPHTKDPGRARPAPGSQDGDHVAPRSATQSATQSASLGSPPVSADASPVRPVGSQDAGLLPDRALQSTPARVSAAGSAMGPSADLAGASALIDALVDGLGATTLALFPLPARSGQLADQAVPALAAAARLFSRVSLQYLDASTLLFDAGLRDHSRALLAMVAWAYSSLSISASRAPGLLVRGPRETLHGGQQGLGAVPVQKRLPPPSPGMSVDAASGVDSAVAAVSVASSVSAASTLSAKSAPPALLGPRLVQQFTSLSYYGFMKPAIDFGVSFALSLVSLESPDSPFSSPQEAGGSVLPLETAQEVASFSSSLCDVFHICIPSLWLSTAFLPHEREQVAQELVYLLQRVQACFCAPQDGPEPFSAEAAEAESRVRIRSLCPQAGLLYTVCCALCLMHIVESCPALLSQREVGEADAPGAPGVAGDQGRSRHLSKSLTAGMLLSTHGKLEAAVFERLAEVEGALGMATLFARSLLGTLESSVFLANVTVYGLLAACLGAVQEVFYSVLWHVAQPLRDVIGRHEFELLLPHGRVVPFALLERLSEMAGDLEAVASRCAEVSEALTVASLVLHHGKRLIGRGGAAHGGFPKKEKSDSSGRLDDRLGAKSTQIPPATGALLEALLRSGAVTSPLARRAGISEAQGPLITPPGALSQGPATFTIDFSAHFDATCVFAEIRAAALFDRLRLFWAVEDLLCADLARADFGSAVREAPAALGMLLCVLVPATHSALAAGGAGRQKALARGLHSVLRAMEAKGALDGVLASLPPLRRRALSRDLKNVAERAAGCLLEGPFFSSLAERVAQGEAVGEGA